MAYIGKQPQIGNYQVCDDITVVNGQATYALQVGGASVSPESSSHVLCSLNGVLQKSGSSFSIASSNIVFSSNLATGDVIDFVILLGNVLDLGVPSDTTVSTAKIVDDAVTAAKINNDIISGTTALATAPDDTDEFLVSDAGTLKRIDYSLIKSDPTHVLLSTTTVSSSVAQVDITSNIDSTYLNYMISFTDARAATDGQQLYLRMFNALGSPHDGSNQYKYALHGYREGDSEMSAASAASSSIQLTRQHSGNQAKESQNGRIFLFNPSGTTAAKQILCYSTGYNGSEEFGYSIGGGANKKDIAYTGVRIYYDSGDIAAGVFKLYGIN
jgi:hypothetical protein